LKPENFVFERFVNSISIKIIDFGVGMYLAGIENNIFESNNLTASLEYEDRYRMITNPYWRSPESWLGMHWGPPADIWSVGAIVSIRCISCAC
jgi:serine/threonine protein kinase